MSLIALGAYGSRSDLSHSRNNELAKARTAFKQAASRNNIDWQEAVLEAWITFETFWGTAESQDAALARVQHVREANASAAARMAAQHTSASHVEATGAAEAPQIQPVEEKQSAPDGAELDRKRKADEPAEPAATNGSSEKKRVRIQEPVADESEPQAGPSSTGTAATLQR